MAIYNSEIHFLPLHKLGSSRSDTMAPRVRILVLFLCLPMTIPIALEFLAPAGIISGLQDYRTLSVLDDGGKNLSPTNQRSEHKSRNEVSTNVAYISSIERGGVNRGHL